MFETLTSNLVLDSVDLPLNATDNSHRVKRPSTKTATLGSAHGTVFCPPCNRFSKKFFEALPVSLAFKDALSAQCADDFSQIHYYSVTVTRTNRFLPH